MKNFVNQSGNWIDSELKKESNLSEVKMKFASHQYSNSLKKSRE